MLPAEQHVQKHAERVHVRGRRDVALRQLFRGGVFRGQWRSAVSRQCARRDTWRTTPLRVARDQLRDAEVQQLDLAIHADEHIGRLDISMHDQVGVRVGDRLQHVEKQANARLDPLRLLVTVAVDGLTVDVLENEVRLAHGRYARIDEASDVRVRHLCEKIAFAPESLLAVAPHQRDVQQLDGHAPFEAAITALRQPDAAHSALADE